jgi:hypothetical protein
MEETNKTFLDNYNNIVFIGFKKGEKEGKLLINIRGTGLLLKNGRVMTCSHVYEEMPENERDSIFCGISYGDASENVRNYKSFDLKFIKKHEMDLALFEIKEKGKIPDGYGIDEKILMTEKEINNMYPSERILFAGFPMSNEFLKMGMNITLIVNECIVGALKYRNSNKKIDFILIDKTVNIGNSGAPVFYKDKIIGLTKGNILQVHKITNKLGEEGQINIPADIGVVGTSNYMIQLLENKTKKGIKK